MYEPMGGRAERMRRGGRPRRGSAAARLLERVPTNSEVSLTDAIALTGRSRESVRRALNRLETAGVLREITGRERGRRWVCDIPLAAVSTPRGVIGRPRPRSGKPHLRARAAA